MTFFRFSMRASIAYFMPVVFFGCVEPADEELMCGDVEQGAIRCAPDDNGDPGFETVEMCVGGNWERVYYCPSVDFGTCIGGRCIPGEYNDDLEWSWKMDCRLGGTEIIDQKPSGLDICCESFYNQTYVRDVLVDQYICETLPESKCATEWEGSPC